MIGTPSLNHSTSASSSSTSIEKVTWSSSTHSLDLSLLANLCWNSGKLKKIKNLIFQLPKFCRAKKLFTSHVELTSGLVLSLFAKLFDSASVSSRVFLLAFANLQTLLAAFALDDEPWIGLFDLLAVLVPFDLCVGVVGLTL